MQDEYIYRFDPTEELRKKFIGDCHRGPRHIPGKRWVYGHELLDERLAALPSNHSIYRICFWTKLEFCLSEIERTADSWPVPRTVSRCKKSEVLSKGFTESEDDGLRGKAYLYWIEEKLDSNNETLSNAVIPFSEFEASVDGEWIPLMDFLKSKSLDLKPQSVSAAVSASGEEVRQGTIKRPGVLDWFKQLL